MVDKLFSARRASIAKKVGTADSAVLREVDKALKLWLQLA
jgi:mRNA-degrading endonuclease toxin of MazEF toxin-antitoxin module